MKRSLIIYFFLLFVIGFSVYAFDLNNILFFDDEHLITDNIFIKELSWSNVSNWFTKNIFAGAGRVSEYYRPLLIASFAFNYAVDGLRPFGYHLVNNLIHIINSFLVFWLALRILKKQWMAFVVTLIFLVHPMQSEGVAYVAGRGDLMASFFMLTGLYVWVRGIETERRLLYLFWSSIFLVLALLSRENAMIFPFLLVVFYVSFISKEKFLLSIKNGFLKVIPHLFIVAMYFTLRLTVLNFRNFLNFGNVDVASVYTNSILVRLYTFLHVFLEYLKTFIFPTNVYEKFTFPISESFFDWPVWGAFTFLVAIGTAILFFYKKEINTKTKTLNKSEKPISHFQIWLFSWGWFFVGLVPSSGIIPTNVLIQDHRLYLSLIGISVLGVFYLGKLIEYLESKNLVFIKWFVVVGLVFYLSFFSWITVKRAIIWGKPVELFEETLRHEPTASAALTSLSKYYIDEKDYDNAERIFARAIENNSGSPYLYYNMAYSRHYGPKKNLDEAIIYYKKSLKILPSYPKTYRGIVEVYLEQANLPEALYYLKKLRNITNSDPNVYYNLSLVSYFLHNKTEALKWAREGLVLSKNDASAKKSFEILIIKIESN